MDEKKKPKKPFEFSKLILAMYAIACIAWIQQNFILAFMEKPQINESVTNVIIGSLAITIIGYYAKSVGEKHSRNKNKLDNNGNPFSVDNIQNVINDLQNGGENE